MMIRFTERGRVYYRRFDSTERSPVHSAPDSDRLLGIEEILADSRRELDAMARSGSDAGMMLLSGAMTERLRKTTAELRRRPASQIDQIDAVTMRLVLTDYMTALAHLRAVTRLAEQRIISAAATLKGQVRFVERIIEGGESAGLS